MSIWIPLSRSVSPQVNGRVGSEKLGIFCGNSRLALAWHRCSAPPALPERLCRGGHLHYQAALAVPDWDEVVVLVK